MELKQELLSILKLALRTPLPSDVEQIQRGSVESWDSLTHIQLVFALEDTFGLVIPESDMQGLDNFNVIADYVKTHLDAT